MALLGGARRHYQRLLCEATNPFQLEGNAAGTIERCDPPKSFAATREFGGGVSWIEVRPWAEPDGSTLFELEHISHVADELWDQFGPGAVGIGWDLTRHGLAKHLTSGRSMSPDQGAAWNASAKGRKFIRSAAAYGVRRISLPEQAKPRRELRRIEWWRSISVEGNDPTD